MARYALVVGISQYRSPLQNLEKTASDAEAVARLLEEHGNFTEVKRLPSRRNKETQKREMAAKPVTGTELGQALRTLLLEQATKSEALIYFTGHGITVSGNLGQPRGYLATSDCEVENQGEQIIAQKHGIALDDLNDLISQSDLSSLVVLFDCCHSGHFLERNLIERTFNALSSQKDYYLITACRSFQQAYALRSEQHSVFTGGLLEALAEKNVDSERRISGDRLFDEINRQLRGSQQEPIRLGWGRSLTLVTYPPLIVPPVVEVASTPTTVNRENPYLGLRAFEPGQADYFFGRVQAVRALLDRLSTGRFLGVIGPSGWGKSSLVKAGLLPELKRNNIPGSSQWPIESFAPGVHPLEALEKALERQKQHNQPFLLFIDQLEELFTLCEDEAERKEFIRRMTEEATSSERLTRVIVTMRGDFLDFCAAYQEVAILINRTKPTTYFVTPLTFAELEEVIEKPAQKHGVMFEAGLVSQIIGDVINQPGALPLLQYALAELWRVCITESKSGQSQLTLKGYDEIRGVKGALEKRANDLYHNLAPADKAFVRRLFLALVQLGEAKEVTRRRAGWQDLEVEADSPEQLMRVTRQLASQEQRLIITDDNTVEVAHEALLAEWGLLREWIEKDRENLRLSRRLKSECQEWQKNGQSEGMLLTDAWLAAIADWVEKTEPRLSSLEREFLQKSLEKRDREIQEQVAKERQLRELAEARAKAEAQRAEQEKARALAEIEKSIEADRRATAEVKAAEQARARAKAEARKTRWAITSAALAIFSLVFGLVAQQQQIEARRNEAFAIARLVSQAQLLFEKGNQIEALSVSINALSQLKTMKEEHPLILKDLKSIIEGIQEANRFVGVEAEVGSVGFSPKDDIIAASEDKVIKLWNNQGKPLPPYSGFSGHEKTIWNLRFSPNGKLIASASRDKTVKIWDVVDKKLLHTLQEHQNSVYGVSFSSDSQKLISSDADGTMKLWNPQTGTLIKTFQDEASQQKKENRPYIYSVDFHPKNSNLIAYAGLIDDKNVKLLDLNTNVSKPLGKHETLVSVVRFSPDGSILASASYDSKIKLWNGKDGGFIREIDAKQNEIYDIGFSPNGKFLASAGDDSTIKLWDVDKALNKKSLEESLELLREPLRGHKGTVNQVSFSPQKQQNKDSQIIIVSGGGDETVRIWRLRLNEANQSKLKFNSQINDLLAYSCNFLSEYLSSQSDLSTASQESKRICKIT